MRQGMTDVLVIGGGIIGLSTALALARRGASVSVLEQNSPGAGASNAAAGVLGTQMDALQDSPFFRLTRESLARYPAFAEELREETGIDVGYRRTGITRPALADDELAAVVRGAAWQRDAGLGVEVLDREALRAVEPAVSHHAVGGVRFPDEARIDPPMLLLAVKIAAGRAGVTIRTGTVVRRVAVREGSAWGVMLENGAIMEGDAVVLAAGSWSSLVGGVPLPADGVQPVRGQMVELLLPAPILGGPVLGRDMYLSPRDDGRVLVGSTREHVGFTPGVTAGAVRYLLDAAIALVPALADAGLSRTWSGFRPSTRDDLPLLGKTSIDKLYAATGHFSNGIVLAPITAEILAAEISGGTPPIDITPFAATRAIA
jgi:glycine oxidase